MKTENGNKPVTPLQFEGYPSSDKVIEKDSCIGLTKREYFASMAMQGMLSNSGMIDGELTESGAEWIAKHSVMQADSLLRELEKE